MNHTVYNISQLFAKKGLSKVVLSPGSRNAPLTISFSRNPGITTYNVVDERSAGFIALGMALKLREPIAVCCTSGSALLNYAPAVSEAYYNQVPLIVVSADRPPEWIDQRDGQTINQVNALQNFVKASYHLPDDLGTEEAKEEFNSKVIEAINVALTAPFGPVHINIPFREPFYPAEGQELAFDAISFEPFKKKVLPFVNDEAFKSWNAFPKKLIVVGQSEVDEQLNEALKKVKNTPVLAEVMANVSSENIIRTHDLFLGALSEDQQEALKPDLLITTGKSLISKNLKLFLRKHKPKQHWHFEDTDQQYDTFRTLTHHFRFPLQSLLAEVAWQGETDTFSQQLEANHLQNWTNLNQRTIEKLEEEISNQAFSEVKAYNQTMESLPTTIDLHFANSTAIRYGNFFQYKLKEATVFSNRGTSGIDGSNGTAVGNAIVGDKPAVLLTGDLSFFYDRNAFFHNYDLSKLKIIVFNNRGGGIFRLISGPSSLPELEQHFETRHTHSAKFTAAEYNFDYIQAKDEDSLSAGLKLIFADNKTPKLLEVFTTPEMNSKRFNEMKAAIQQALAPKKE